tara:strand:+ start:845 stop:1234 length:390 start_codon:yes stop_codon:yes gene_type:complete
MTDTQTHSQSAAHASNMLTIVETALFAKDRLPAVGRNPHGQDVASFHLAARSGGWAPTITFKGGSAGSPAKIYPSKKEAFLAGAETLCRILSGSKKLPFVVEGDMLMVAGYGTGGFQGIFMMKMPAPWI